MTTLYLCGAGNSEGVRLALTINEKRGRWNQIVLLDDDPSKQGKFILGVEVVGPFKMLEQADQLTLSVISSLEGDQESEIVKHMLHMRDALGNLESNEEMSMEATSARDALINIVNNFFYEKLTGIPEIKTYMDGFKH